ncbi:MAG: LysM peptidoglycan-binding domain-containing protein [Deltaproteobacteria bacterium]|nr:MAG: LysM peptidoglycan-binding domain-containing protein [Deltaproteobacteria bacterium]
MLALALFALRMALGDPAADEAAASGPAVAAAASQTKVLDRPRWIRHVVRPRERWSQIAVRYGVRIAKLKAWNEGVEERYGRPKTGERLRVYARRIPPPRRRIEHVVQPGEDFGTIAARYRVEYRDLLAYNWPNRSADPGDVVTVWIDPDFPPRTVGVAPGPPLPERFDVPEGARSVGRPNRGRLEHGARLPDAPWYTVREPAIAYGSSHTLRVLMETLARFRHRTGYAGEILIGSISRPWGRRFPPHKSHQSGRDVDIRLPLLPGVPRKAEPHPDEIDWSATWELLREFAASGEVEVIFLDIHLQRRVFQAALWEGATPEEIRPILQWPAGKGSGRALVRHEEGHDGHIHVRVRCGPDEPKCRPRRRRPSTVAVATAAP